jgi:hypothetical protein
VHTASQPQVAVTPRVMVQPTIAQRAISAVDPFILALLAFAPQPNALRSRSDARAPRRR